MDSQQHIKHQISTTLGDSANEFDIDAIADDIFAHYGRSISTIDVIPSDHYWQIVLRHHFE